MADKIEWVWKVVDMATSPLKLITAGLEKAAHAAENTHGAFEKLGAGSGLTSAVVKADLLAKGIEGAAEAVAEMVKKVGEGVIKFAEMGIEAMAFKEVNLSALEVLTGSRKEAQGLFKEFAQLHLITPWQTSQTVETATKLLSSGVKKENLRDMFLAVSDVASMSGVDANVMDRLSYAMAEVNSIGHLTGRTMMMLQMDGARAGIGFEALSKQLAKIKGVAPEAIHAMISAGQIGSAEFQKAYVDAVTEKFGGLGKASEMKGFGTVKGLWSTLKSTMENVFLLNDEDTKQSRGMNALEGAMRNVVMLFNMGTKSGKAFGDLVYGVWNDLMVKVFGSFSGEQGVERLQELFKKLMVSLKNIGDILTGPLVEGTKAFFGALFGKTLPFGKEMNPADLEKMTAAAKEFGTALGGILVDLKDLVFQVTKLLHPGSAMAGIEGASAKTGTWTDYLPSMQDNAAIAAHTAKEMPAWAKWNPWEALGVVKKVEVTVKTEGPAGSTGALEKGAAAGAKEAVAMAAGAR